MSITRVAVASICCGLFQASAWPTVNPTHGRGFLQPGRVSEIQQPNLRHLKIVMEIDEVEHHPIANGGANYVQYWIDWEFTSSVATNIPVTMPSWPLFLSKEGEPEFAGQRIVYHGEVPNGCNADVDLQLHLTVETSPDGEQTYSDHISMRAFTNGELTKVHDLERDSEFLIELPERIEIHRVLFDRP